MDGQKGHDIVLLEKLIVDLRAELKKLGDDAGYDELLIYIRQPHWTTPAEYLLVRGMLEVMHEQVRAFNTFTRVLVNGSRIVGAEQER